MNDRAGAVGPTKTTRREDGFVRECFCGLPMSRNPHPDAGKPEHVVKVGAEWVCVPCTVKAMSGWASRYHQEARMAAHYAERLRHEGIDPDAGLP